MIEEWLRRADEIDAEEVARYREDRREDEVPEEFKRCYNAQVTVNAEHQLIDSTEMAASASDQGQVIAQLDAVKGTYGRQQETVLEDSDYGNEQDLAELEERGSDGWIKEALGSRRFSVRGLQQVQGDWDLVCLALNVKRLQASIVALMGSLRLKLDTRRTHGEPCHRVIGDEDRFSRRDCVAAGAPRMY